LFGASVTQPAKSESTCHTPADRHGRHSMTISPPKQKCYHGKRPARRGLTDTGKRRHRTTLVANEFVDETPLASFEHGHE
jgi:hypothetical protein